MKHWTHRGPLHWLTACWHPLATPPPLPGHMLPFGWTVSDILDKCCVCDRIRLNGNGMVV